MFAGTLGRNQFFARSGLLGMAETVVLGICIAIQQEAFFGPPGEGRYRLAATAFLASAFFGYKRIGYVIRRNRDAGDGDLLAGLYMLGTCTAIVLQVQALVVRTSENPMNGLEYAGLLYLLLGCIWFYLLFAAPVPPEARSHAEPSPTHRLREEGEAVVTDSPLSLAMEQAISGKKPVPAAPAPARPQGFLAPAGRPPMPRQRNEFGRRGLK